MQNQEEKESLKVPEPTAVGQKARNILRYIITQWL